MFTRIFAGSCAIVLSAGLAHARHVERWSYDKLSKRADVVVVATVISTDVWDEGEEEPQLGDVVFAGQLTKLDVKGVLKGNVPDRRLDLVHYRVVTNGRIIAPGVRVSHSRAYVAEFPERTPSTRNHAANERQEADPQHY